MSTFGGLPLRFLANVLLVSLVFINSLDLMNTLSTIQRPIQTSPHTIQHGQFPVDIIIATDRDFLKATFADEVSREIVNIVYFTDDFGSDAYLKLYMGQWASNFEYMKRGYRVIIFDYHNEKAIEKDLYFEVLPLLPKFSIF